ncbi:hypothetical protein [Frigidibacter sp. SD6-1]|uniref:hypothetical protein n=1 Tax=Frigidibacter sp. SD6-1 TaxID=3032581 RepID=UPI0024DFADAC|nr:hypothetical protein [Frigidibacter sp. SD6-1]
MALICKHCEKRERPILFVAYTPSDGIYQFLCGEDGHEVDDADPIHIDHVAQDDPSVVELFKHDVLFEAERESEQHPWRLDFNPDLD